MTNQNEKGGGLLPAEELKRPVVGSGDLVRRPLVQQINDLLLVKRATGVSAEDIMGVIERNTAANEPPHYARERMVYASLRARGLIA